jgi:hypothetical protein
MQRTIIGISLGSRYIGYAILRDTSTLEDWHIHGFKEQWSGTKLRRIIAFLLRIAEFHKATEFAVKLPPLNKKSRLVQKLLKELQAKAIKRGYTFTTYSLEELKAACPAPIKNKRALMAHVNGLFPCLKRFYDRELAVRNHYHLKVFEAALAAYILVLHLSEQKSLSICLGIPSPYCP